MSNIATFGVNVIVFIKIYDNGGQLYYSTYATSTSSETYEEKLLNPTNLVRKVDIRNYSFRSNRSTISLSNTFDLKRKFSSPGFYGNKIEIFTGTEADEPEDFKKVFTGHIKKRSWTEKTFTFTFYDTDSTELLSVPRNPITKGDWIDLPPESEGQLLPIIVGEISDSSENLNRLKCISIDETISSVYVIASGRITRILNLYVNGAVQIPSIDYSVRLNWFNDKAGLLNRVSLASPLSATDLVTVDIEGQGLSFVTLIPATVGGWDYYPVIQFPTPDLDLLDWTSEFQKALVFGVRYRTPESNYTVADIPGSTMDVIQFNENIRFREGLVAGDTVYTIEVYNNVSLSYRAIAQEVVDDPPVLFSTGNEWHELVVGVDYGNERYFVSLNDVIIISGDWITPRITGDDFTTGKTATFPSKASAVHIHNIDIEEAYFSNYYNENGNRKTPELGDMKRLYDFRDDQKTSTANAKTPDLFTAYAIAVYAEVVKSTSYLGPGPFPAISEGTGATDTHYYTLEMNTPAEDVADVLRYMNQPINPATFPLAKEQFDNIQGTLDAVTKSLNDPGQWGGQVSGKGKEVLRQLGQNCNSIIYQDVDGRWNLSLLDFAAGDSQKQLTEQEHILPGFQSKSQDEIINNRNILFKTNVSGESSSLATLRSGICRAAQSGKALQGWYFGTDQTYHLHRGEYALSAISRIEMNKTASELIIVNFKVPLSVALDKDIGIGERIGLAHSQLPGPAEGHGIKLTGTGQQMFGTNEAWPGLTDLTIEFEIELDPAASTGQVFYGRGTGSAEIAFALFNTPSIPGQTMLLLTQDEFGNQNAFPSGILPKDNIFAGKITLDYANKRTIGFIKDVKNNIWIQGLDRTKTYPIYDWPNALEGVGSVASDVHTNNNKFTLKKLEIAYRFDDSIGPLEDPDLSYYPSKEGLQISEQRNIIYSHTGTGDEPAIVKVQNEGGTNVPFLVESISHNFRTKESTIEAISMAEIIDSEFILDEMEEPEPPPTPPPVIEPSGGPGTEPVYEYADFTFAASVYEWIAESVGTVQTGPPSRHGANATELRIRSQIQFNDISFPDDFDIIKAAITFDVSESIRPINFSIYERTVDIDSLGGNYSLGVGNVYGSVIAGNGAKRTITTSDCWHDFETANIQNGGSGIIKMTSQNITLNAALEWKMSNFIITLQGRKLIA